jgi:hypothetical protein
MGGIGVISLVGGLIIYTYVNMMMAWALYFFVLSFYSPIPFLQSSPCGDGASYLFYHYVLRMQTEECQFLEIYQMN